jgi:pyruvate,water dikinase
VAGNPHTELNPTARDAAAWLVPLEKLGRQDGALVGAKAANLGELSRAGLQVPPGFCVTTAAFRTWLEGQGAGAASLRERLEHLFPEAKREVREVTASLRQELGTLPIPGPLQDALRQEVQRRGPDHAWAVRSSATAEDLPGASFAGQYDSLLNVRGADAILEAVRQCWVSLFTERAVLYRLKNQIRHRDLSMAVLVQQMAPAAASGVMFTANPLTGDTTRMVIEAVRGPGEALVSGRSNPDRWVLDKATLQVLERTMGEPETEPIPSAETARSEKEGGSPRRSEFSLAGSQVRRLGELGRALEKLSDRPQDIEWTACDDQFWVVQSRPITALPPVQPGDSEIWTNANIMEALPGVVTPMSWSLMQKLLEQFLNPLMGRLGLDTTSRPLMGLVAGRAYLNVRAIVALVQQIGGPLQVNVMRAFGGQHSGMEKALSPGPPRAAGLPHRIKVWRFLKLSRWLLPGLIGQQRLLERWGRRVMGDLAHMPPASLSDEQLAELPQALVRLAAVGEGERTWAAAAWMALAAVGGGTALFHFAREWLGNTDDSVANRLLAGTNGMLSAENGRELLRFAAWARKRPELRAALLEPVQFDALRQKLPKVPGGLAFLQRWHTFMEHHGHQARGGMDMSQPRWSEMPDFVLDMLRTYLRFEDESDPLAAQSRQLRERERLLADCRQRLRNPFKRWLFSGVLRAARRGLTQRENVKNEGVRMTAILRRAALEAGERLRTRDLLANSEDVFFLRLDELMPALRDGRAFDVPAVVAARKAEHERLRALDPPPVVVGEYKPQASGEVPSFLPGRTLRGVAVSPGVVIGKARVVARLETADRIEPGEILVAPFTDPGWTPLFLAAAGVVVDIGGLFSHGSVVAREYGLPAVVNVGPATRLIRTGQRIQVDGNHGVVTIVD